MITKNIITLSLFLYGLTASAQVMQTADKHTVTLDTELEYRTGYLKGGALQVDGTIYHLYVPGSGPYQLVNTNPDKVQALYNTATKVYVDYDNNGKIDGSESWSADHPIRFGNRMLSVSSITGDKVILFDSKSVLSGLVAGLPALDFEFTDTDGKLHKLKDYRGKFLLLDVWSTTCHNCRENIPKVRELQQQFGEDKLSVLLLSMDMAYGLPAVEKRNKETIVKLGVPWPNVLVPSSWIEMVTKFNIQGYGLLLIGPDGKVLVNGFSHQMEVIRSALNLRVK